MKFYQSKSSDHAAAMRAYVGDCSECDQLKTYSSCTCDGDMKDTRGMAPDQERCTFVIGNEDAPSSNAAPALVEKAVSNTAAVDAPMSQNVHRRNMFSQSEHLNAPSSGGVVLPEEGIEMPKDTTNSNLGGGKGCKMGTNWSSDPSLGELFDGVECILADTMGHSQGNNVGDEFSF
jgi:hypothetical protein